MGKMEKIGKVSRISVSMPDHLLEEFDELVAERGFESRSAAISDLIAGQIDDHRQEHGTDIMTGTLNLVYNHSVGNVQKKLADLQYEHIAEVISSLNVNLTHTNTLSVVLVQGPANKLRTIADRMIAQRGVITGRLYLCKSIIPPIHYPSELPSETL